MATQTPPTVEEFLRSWHEEHVVPTLRASSAYRYRTDIRHIVPHIGSLPLHGLGPRDIQAMEARLLSDGLSPRTVGHVHSVLSTALRHAVRMGILDANPCDPVQPPRRAAPGARPPDLETVRRLLALSRKGPYFPLYHFLAYTGARRGEGLGLQWGDVDLAGRGASISRTLSYSPDRGLELLPPKTRSGRRRVSLDRETVRVLRGIRPARPGEAEHVFAGARGKPLWPAAVTRHWTELARWAGHPGVRLHDLRHFHATVLLMRDVHPKVVQERLGHSTINVTLDTYSHVVPSLQAEAADLFSRAMEGGRRRARRQKPAGEEGA